MTNDSTNERFGIPDVERYFEDYVAGAVHDLGSVAVEAAEIVEFARRYDPQDIHIDAEKARDGAFGGLIASGWHTAGMMMRLFGQNFLSNVSSLGSPGLTDLRWLAPVRPGDTLSVRVTIRDSRRSASKPDRGVVETFIEVLNQDGVVVMDMVAVNLIARRNAD